MDKNRFSRYLWINGSTIPINISPRKYFEQTFSFIYYISSILTFHLSSSSTSNLPRTTFISSNFAENWLHTKQLRTILATWRLSLAKWLTIVVRCVNVNPWLWTRPKDRRPAIARAPVRDTRKPLVFHLPLLGMKNRTVASGPYELRSKIGKYMLWWSLVSQIFLRMCSSYVNLVFISLEWRK